MVDFREFDDEIKVTFQDMIKGDAGHSPVMSGKKVDNVNSIYADDKKLIDVLDGKDGKTPVKGVDYFDGKDGHTPIKGVDYNDGHTPIMSGGKVGDVSTIYADGEPLISVEDGNSIDVQINGSSIVHDGVANIPPASEATYGLIKPGSYFATRMSSGGALIANEITAQNFFSVNVGDNAFVGKKTLCNVLAAPSLMPSLTDAEKAAARSRIGICDGELIADITLTEDASYVDILKDTNGNSISLKKAAIFISAKSGNSITWGNVGYWTNGTYKGSTTGASIYAFSSASTDNYSSAFFDCSCGVSRAFSVDAGTNNFGAGMVRCRSNVLYEVNKYDGFRVDSALKAGSTIQVYGLRA